MLDGGLHIGLGPRCRTSFDRGTLSRFDQRPLAARSGRRGGSKVQEGSKVLAFQRDTFRASKCFPHDLLARTAWIAGIKDQAFPIWRPTNESIRFDS